MGAFLCWLGVRLMEMHRVLRHDGSLYLHIDYTAHAYVKCLLDAIFGEQYFRNEIVWYYKTGGVSRRWFGRKHDTLLYYTKSDQYTFKLQKEKSYLSHKYGFSNVDIKEDDRGFYTMVTMRDVWDIAALRGNQPEATGFPTQKPLALYERIILASSNEGDIVLDPFCGCATTPVAAERLKRQWLGMDIWDGAKDIVVQRLESDTMLRAGEDNHVTLPQVHFVTEPPVRTDGNEIAAPTLKLRIKRPMEPWEKISHRGMRNILAAAQANMFGVICAGCGRDLEREFMQLDHILPKAEGGVDHILNRILLCGPCNRRKGNYLTLAGLRRENKKKAIGWMKDEKQAIRAQDKARASAEWVRDYFDTDECQALITGIKKA